ncbi:MAG: mandelate racemase/muconate lactonizing enzyme family protein, partial [Candidatus Poribacteria bacterium]|nr:mandelate racemase/muconate lactonizing enzyme family protein [Candidatus Poribacteria bacterium]
PAVCWEFVELTTKEGLIGTGEWPIELDAEAKNCLAQLQEEPERNLLDLELEAPLFMAWWDLVGQVLSKPLHVLWADLFERGFHPPATVPMAAYTWQRFPDANGDGAVTFDTWPEHAAERARQGFPAIKVSMTAYQPEDHIELIHQIRQAVGPQTAIRVDAHGTWNYQEARRILAAIEDCNLEYIEQPINALLPQRFYPKDEPIPARPPEAGGFQSEYYFRKMTDLRREIRTPLSCHWWTPPIIHPPGASVMSNQWEPHWYMLQRYEAADISVPDIGLGPWGLWRITQLAKFMGMHVTVHSNFELCLQLSFRAALVSALVYETESAGLYMGTTPRVCHPIDNETIQVSDDVIEGGPFDWSGGHLQLSDKPGHGLRLDPERLEKYRYTPESVAPHREYAMKLYANYRLDRPRRTTQSGWPKQAGPETFSRHIYPYSLAQILDAEADQDIDVELNR